jgi:hypothetical protein
MITYDKLTPAQSKWLDLVEILFPTIYEGSIINHSQLKMIHDELSELRKTDKKYKVGWPIWLIMNNSVTRGMYKLPKETEIIEEVIDPDVDNPYYNEYVQELARFGITVDGSNAADIQ